MRIRALTVALAIIGTAAASAALSAQRNSAPRTSAVERGRYLVEDAIQCAQCHTPRTEIGELDRSRWLMGGPVFYRPSAAVGDWAQVTPRLAGGPPGTEQDFIRLMTTAIARTGAPPRPPMLQLHLSRADAEAIYAYLKSLAPSDAH